MGDVLSQEEIEAMLSAAGQIDDDPSAGAGGAGGGGSAPAGGFNTDDYLSKDEQDVLGEVANMCMGTSATTMSTLLSKRVMITTPTVTIQNMETLSGEYPAPLIVAEVSYIKGINGDNLLILKEFDVALITNVLLGESTDIDPNEPIDLTEIHMSAMNEVMNQMVGSSATSLADILHKTIDISTPTTRRLELEDGGLASGSFANTEEPFVRIGFKMEIEDLLSSEIMQIMPLTLAKEMVNDIMGDIAAETESVAAAAPTPQPEPVAAAPQPDMAAMGVAAPQPDMAAMAAPDPMMQQPQYAPQPDPYAQQPYPPQYAQQPYPPQGYPPQYAQQPYPPQQAAPHNVIRENVNVAEAQFPSFGVAGGVVEGAENIGMILDVPMHVTVELGKAKQKIKDILGYNMGSVIVLDKVAGEAVDVLVNGKRIGRGEVVVIDDNYGVRITEITSFTAEELL